MSQDGGVSSAYYNEHDPYAAQWLRNLIAAGHIAPGDVDERSIEDVRPDDLDGYTQCHFFAGIGAWSYALRLAGWPDDKPVWTGSCPCQPFSAAGKGKGAADERHLWPAWFHLIEQCRPGVVFGEQVAAAIGHGWLDLVQSDMEGIGYAFAAAGIPAAGVGAPHIRQRLWFVADSNHTRLEGWGGMSECAGQRAPWQGSMAGGVAVPDRTGCREGQGDDPAARYRHPTAATGIDDRYGSTGPTNGCWRDADWLFCRDGKWRPVEPGFQQMADGSSASLGRVRAGTVQEIQEEIDAWAIRYQADAGESLRGVWRNLQSQALCERQAGRFSGVQSPSVLLAFLRQLSEQGWRFSDSLACASAGASQIVVRILRFDPGAARTPLRRELAEQLPEQPADPLQELSSILAHHAEKCWGEACREKASAATFPLATSAPARVGRLRAYGNAIVPQVAAEFITAYMEASA